VAHRRAVAAAAILVALAAILAAAIGPGMHAQDDFGEAGTLELGREFAPPGVRAFGDITVDRHGYRVRPQGRAIVRVPVPRTPTGLGAQPGRMLLRIWAYGPDGVSTSVRLVDGRGGRRELGTSRLWIGRTFDVTEQAAAGSVRLTVRATNTTDDPILFLDRVAPINAAESARITATRAEVAVLVAAILAALLALVGILRRHWPLVPLGAFAAWLLWADVPGRSLVALQDDQLRLWNAVRDASWLGFHDGLLWGSWRTVSSLSVQLFHLLTPIVGTADASARAAGALVGVAAICAIYALGHRVAGGLGAVVAVLLALATDAFRLGSPTGSALPVLVLAAACFAVAVHAALPRATTAAMVLVGVAGGVLVLAEPTWLPGVAAAIAILAAAYALRGERLRAAGGGLLALALFILPNRTSTAAQNDGSVLADMSARATYARNVEFLGAGHGAPSPLAFSRDPFSGEPATLTEYLLGDHSLSQIVGGILTGGYEALVAFADNDASGALGTIAFVVLVCGALYLLAVPRLRMLVLLGVVVCAPALFIAARGGASAFAAASVLWVGLLAAGGVLAYAVHAIAARPAIGSLGRWFAGRRRIPFPRARSLRRERV
jgi:hypothetical protein